MNILYFAWLRTTIGKEEEKIDLPETVKTVDDVLNHLRERGSPYSDVLSTDKVVRVAVNQDYAKGDDLVKNGDEFAIFPPVTGG